MTLPKSRALIELQLEALLDDAGDAQPWVFLARTAEGNAWRLSQALPEALSCAIEGLLREEPVVADFEPEPRCAAALRALLAERVSVAREYRGPVFWLPELPVDAAGVETDPGALRAWVFSGGREVAVCHAAALSPRVAEAGVETHPDFRRRGLGAHVVRAWAGLVRASGRLPLYGTQWSNAASRALAHRLGARLFGEDFHLDPP